MRIFCVISEHHYIFLKTVEGTGIRAYLDDCVPGVYKYIEAYITFLDIVLPLLSTPKEYYEQLLEDSTPFKFLTEKLSLELK